MTHDDVRCETEALLGRALGPGQALVEYEGASNVVHRFEDGDRSVVVKRSRMGRGPLVPERIALELLADTDAAGLVPAVVAGDAEGELLVLTDLGFRDDQRMCRILEADDRALAEWTLHAHATALARLHGASVAIADAFAARLSSTAPHTRSRHALHELPRFAAGLPAILAEYGATEAAHMAAETEEVVAGVVAPGPFRTLTNGDATGANAAVVGDRLVLFDFETADVRHALVDGAFARIRFLHSTWAHDVPDELRRAVTRTYREALAPAISEAADDARYAAAESLLAAALLGVLLRRHERVRDADERWGRSTGRAVIARALDAFLGIAEEGGELPALCDGARAMRLHVTAHWPAANRVMPVYPALA